MFELSFIWAGIIAFAVLTYVILDGFDLGVGILFPFADSEQEKALMMNTVAPIWDGNETWLVLGGGGLFAVFPLAYAVVMPALYMPIILMLLERVSNALRDHVLAGPAIFMDDTTVKLLQKGKGRGKNKTKTARLWVYARDEKPWGSTSPPAAWYQFSTSREAKHPSQHLQTYKGFAHADAYAGYNDAYRTGRVTEMACMVHIRREFVKVFESYKLPMAQEAIESIAKLYEVEKRARFKSPQDRVALRQEYAKPIFDDLEVWLRAQLNKMSGKTPLAKAIKYALTRLPKARPYLDRGFLELDNNTAERAVRPVTLGRKNYLFMGSEAGGKSAAIAYTLIETCKLNRVNPEAWLAWVLERIQDHPANRIGELMPWAYQAMVEEQKAEPEAKNVA